MTFGPSMCNIACRCGHVADLELFAVAPSRYRRHGQARLLRDVLRSMDVANLRK